MDNFLSQDDYSDVKKDIKKSKSSKARDHELSASQGSKSSKKKNGSSGSK